MIYIINKVKDEPVLGSIPIYRGKSPLGNPFTHIRNKETKAGYICNTREEAINEYEKYLNKKINENDIEICNELNKIYELAINGDVTLVCYCSPKKCHGEIIKKVIDARIVLDAVRNRKKNESDIVP